MKAYHFTKGDKLRDGRPIPAIGEKLVHTEELVLCKKGLHASVDIFDALKYAPGTLLHIVECSGEVLVSYDKLVCSERTILRSVQCSAILREFAKWCARQVVHLWDAPEIVGRYLETGDESIRDNAWRASLHTSFEGDGVAMRAAAKLSALAASRDTGSDWARAVTVDSRDAALDAAYAAARAVAYDAVKNILPTSSMSSAWSAHRIQEWSDMFVTTCGAYRTKLLQMIGE